MLLATWGALALGLSLTGGDTHLVQPVGLSVRLAEPEMAAEGGEVPPPEVELPEGSFVDEQGRVTTLSEVVDECLAGDDLASCPSELAEPAGGLRGGPFAGFWSKVRSLWLFPRRFHHRTPRIEQPIFARHAAVGSIATCEDICSTSGGCEVGCCSEDACEWVSEEEFMQEPVHSSAEPCPACQHVIAPSPALPKVTPVPSEPVTEEPAVEPVEEEAPPLPSREKPRSPGVETPVREEEASSRDPSLDEDVPTRPIPTESSSSRRLGTEVVPTSFEEVGPHAADFSWIVGELRLQHTRGGVWTLRYLPLDQTDSFGGQVVLGRDARLAGFREGDLVRVEGRLGKTPPQGSPNYRITRIRRP
jgi:hypothetical protein